MEREVLPSTRIPLQRACEARCEKGIIGKGGKDRTKKIVSIQVHGPTESIRSLGETKEKKNCRPTAHNKASIPSYACSYAVLDWKWNALYTDCMVTAKDKKVGSIARSTLNKNQ